MCCLVIRHIISRYLKYSDWKSGASRAVVKIPSFAWSQSQPKQCAATKGSGVIRIQVSLRLHSFIFYFCIWVLRRWFGTTRKPLRVFTCCSKEKEKVCAKIYFRVRNTDKGEAKNTNETQRIIFVRATQANYCRGWRSPSPLHPSSPSSVHSRCRWIVTSFSHFFF